MKLQIYAIFLLLITPFISAKEYHLPLLAVKETSEGFKGSSADLYLEIRNGQGRVFLDTYPLTKLDTQMSTRFAKEIACSLSDFDCDRYDFLYTIESDSIIVGGPSAGAAISLLTLIALTNNDIEKDIAITGTINSGGIIGPVGALKEKIEAAKDKGITKVLIPFGETQDEEKTLESNETEKNISNSSINLVEYGKSLGIEIIQIATLNDVFLEFTGSKINQQKDDLVKNQEYHETMKIITKNLCDRSEELKKSIDTKKLKENESILLFENANNLTERSKEALAQERYYSAASYCFGANTKLAYLSLRQKDINKSEILNQIVITKSAIKKMNNLTDQISIRTITDLETYMVVKERLAEAEESIDNVMKENETDKKLELLSYGQERLSSAVSWSTFFGKGSKAFDIKKDQIKKSCMNKIFEAEERNEYLKLLTSMEFDSSEKDISAAKKQFENEEYELCLFSAAKAKAESDVILSSIGVTEHELPSINEKKLEIIKTNLIKEQQKGVFPVVAYSYYEYANSLKENDIISSMLFAEYSLELSSLDIYFKDYSHSIFTSIYKYVNSVELIVVGLILGIILGYSINTKRKK